MCIREHKSLPVDFRPVHNHVDSPAGPLCLGWNNTTLFVIQSLLTHLSVKVDFHVCSVVF